MTQHVVVLLIMDMESAKFDVNGPKKKVRFWRILIKKWQKNQKITLKMFRPKLYWIKREYTSCSEGHWRQTQPLLRSNRAGVRWLSHRLWTRREESPAQRKIGGIAVKTSFEQLFVQYKCTVVDEINGHYLQLPQISLQGFPLYKAHQIGRATTGEPTPSE